MKLLVLLKLPMLRWLPLKCLCSDPLLAFLGFLRLSFSFVALEDFFCFFSFLDFFLSFSLSLLLSLRELDDFFEELRLLDFLGVDAEMASSEMGWISRMLLMFDRAEVAVASRSGVSDLAVMFTSRAGRFM